MSPYLPPHETCPRNLCPRAVYDNEFDELPASQQADAKLRKKLKAMAYMNINVFEIVFAVHPEGTGESAWKKYFEDTIKRCTFVRQELRDNSEIYNRALIKVFNNCPESKLPDKSYPPTV